MQFAVLVNEAIYPSVCLLSVYRPSFTKLPQAERKRGLQLFSARKERRNRETERAREKESSFKTHEGALTVTREGMSAKQTLKRR